MSEQKKKQILLPEGCFEGYCGGCFWGKRKIMDSEGRFLCKGECGGYHYENDGQGCQHYEGRVITWIKIIGGLYLLFALFVAFIEFLFF